MKYSKNKKSKFSFFAIVYSLVMMLAILQVGSVVFGGIVIAVDEWNQTTKPVSGINIIEDSGNKTTMVVSTPAALDYALYYASNPVSDVYLTIELAGSINMSAKYIKPKTLSNTKLKKLTILGNRYTISGLKFSSVTDNRMGLISYLKVPFLAQDLNLRVEMGTQQITTLNNAFGTLIGVTENTDVTLTRCAVYGTINITNCVYGVGGLIGYTNTKIASINNCWSYCTITSSKEGCYVGGLVGFLSCSSIYNCANFEGSIKATANASVGGLFGYVNSVSSIDKCFNQANVESAGGYVGGIIGQLGTSNVKVNDCYNNADLSCGDGTVVGGLVGNSASGLVFNHCYSYGKLTRKLGKVDLTEDTAFGKIELGNYLTDNSSDPLSNSWNISYNADINIQNNGGGDSGGGGNSGGGGGSSEPTTPPAPTNRISAGISKKEVRTSKVIVSNLCGVKATYNNSICVDKKNSESFYRSVTMLRLSLYFNYNGTSHNAGTIRFRDYEYNYNNGGWNDGGVISKYEGYGRYSYTYKKVYFPYSSQYSLSSYDDNLFNDIGSYSREYYTSGYIAGIELDCDEGGVSIHLFGKFKFTYDNINSSSEIEEELGSWETFYWDELKYDNADSLLWYNASASDIKIDTIGNEFAIINGVNGGLPILKDFYWGY